MGSNAMKLNGWDTMMMAAAFAEAGEYETARSIMDPSSALYKRPEKRAEKRNERRPRIRV